MTTRGRRSRSASPTALSDLAAAIVGEDLTVARRRARTEHIRLEDRTAPGWYTQEYDPGRIAVIVDEHDRIVRATPG